MREELINALYQIMVAGQNKDYAKTSRQSITKYLKYDKLPRVADLLLKGEKYAAGSQFTLVPKTVNNIFRIHMPGIKEYYPLFFEEAKKILIYYGFRKKIKEETQFIMKRKVDKELEKYYTRKAIEVHTYDLDNDF